MAQANLHPSIQQNGSKILDDVVTCNGSQDECSPNAETKPEEILIKWQTAMKRSYEAQLLLQEVIDTLTCAIHKNKSSKKIPANGHLCHSNGIIASSSNSSSSSDSEPYCSGRATHRKHHYYPQLRCYDCKYSYCSRCDMTRDHSRGHSVTRRNGEEYHLHHRRNHEKYPVIDGYC